MNTKTVEVIFECDAMPDVQWKVESGSLTQALNAPYTLTLQLATENMDAEPVVMLGQPAKLTLTRDTVMRQVTGIVSEVQDGNTHPEMVTASVEVVPALEALRHRVNTKIFQEMTVPDILEEVLNESLGGWDRSVDNRLSRTYPTCEYRVQYDESDFSFCRRLMEEEGIVYWFEFDGEAETMVLADADSEWGTIESLHEGAVTFALQEGQVGGHEYISNFEGLSQIVPTKVTTRHFDWTHPSVPIEGENSDAEELERPHGGSLDPEREVYEHDENPLTLSEYDGAAYGANDVDDQVRLRREAQAWEAFVCEGRSTVLGMTTGSIFEFTGHPRAELDGRYIVISATHDFDSSSEIYVNSFECLPEGVPFRPEREGRRPRIASIQTATVVGPSGEEIHTDEHGRIKVQFHWDRLGANDEHSSCWVRVMQPWAGAGWGFVFIPRMGMEVVVRFIDGDPDRPVVIGSVYNAENPPPYALPDEKTKSTIKTETSLGGGGFNEWRFEDKAGSEEIFTHAQKDQNEVIENDHTLTVHHDETITIDNDQTQDIGNDQTEHVMNNQSLEVDVNRTIQVHGNFEETIDGSETRTVSSGVTETIDAGETRTITGGMTEDISGDRTQTINGSSVETITGALAQTIIGGATITTPAAYEITAAAGITITAPAGVMILSPGGHTLVAPAGQTFIDGSQANSGSLHSKLFSDEFALRGINIGVQGLATTALGLHAELSMIKIAKVGTSVATKPLFSPTHGDDHTTKSVEVEIVGIRSLL